jgi:hypothetical protein
MKFRKFAVPVAVVAVALGAFATASADTQYMDAPGCVGYGQSAIASGNAYTETVGCSGSSTYIAATVYKTGGGQSYCPINWTWYATDWIWCEYTLGDAASIYTSHRLLYNGNYSNYAVTQD